ncbi:MAG TPA: hypothetical protein VF175_08695, partial [Lacipirellula sp.]
LLWKVLDRGSRVAEHPAMLRSRVAGQSKMRVVRAASGHLRLIGKIALARLKPWRGTAGKSLRSPPLDGEG